MATESQEDKATPVIYFEDAVSRKFTFPFEMVRDWEVCGLQRPHGLN